MSSPRSAQQRRDLRNIVADGGLWSGMVGVGEAYVPAFALALGLGDVVAGLVATVPMLAGALVQLATPWAVRRLGSYRRAVVACAALQAASFVPLVVLGLRGRPSLFWMGVATVAYWAFGMATGPAWNAWITSLVPADVRARFFAHRSRIAQASLLAALLVGGLLLEVGREHGRELLAFAGLFVAAGLLRVLSARCLARQSEEPGLPALHASLDRGHAGPLFRHRGTRRLLAYLAVMMAFTNVAAPFFTPYMLGPLGLGYERYMLLTAAAFAARIAVLPIVGRLAERHGPRSALLWGGWAIVPLPMLWLVSDDFVYLTFVQLAAGCAWAAIELATVLVIFESVDESVRTRVLTFFNVLNASAITGGALLGAWLFSGMGAGPPAFAALFVASSAGRLASLVLLRGVPTVAAPHGEEVVLRTLAVRPSAGAIQRPILTTFEDDEPAPSNGHAANAATDDGPSRP